MAYEITVIPVRTGESHSFRCERFDYCENRQSWVFEIKDNDCVIYNHNHIESIALFEFDDKG